MNYSCEHIKFFRVDQQDLASYHNASIRTLQWRMLVCAMRIPAQASRERCKESHKRSQCAVLWPPLGVAISLALFGSIVICCDLTVYFCHPRACRPLEEVASLLGHHNTQLAAFCASKMRPEQLHAKLQLVHQLKQLARQHEQILDAYQQKVEARIGEAARLATGNAGKRPGAPLVAEGPEAKRMRMLHERERRKKELWEEIIKIVEKIRKNPKSEPFRIPVDPIRLKIPDYPTIIRNPMDIGTVMKKLRSNPRPYQQPSEVADDVRLIWSNCRTYNGLNHPVTASANVLSEQFEKAWGQSNIEHKWLVERQREDREEQAFAQHGAEDAVGDDDIVTQLRMRRNLLGDLIAAKDVQDNLPPGALGELQPDRDMTFEEKRKLSAHMASLPGEKLTAVLDIIEECEDLPSDDGQERELDVDMLNNSTLWKLKAYVDGVLTATTGPPPKKTAANRVSGGGAPNKLGPPPPAAGAAPAAQAAVAAVAPPPPAPAAVPPVEGGMQAPPPAANGPADAAQPAAAAEQPAAAEPADAAADVQRQQQPQQQQQQEPQQQQQQPAESPQDSAGEVVASTAGGAGIRPVPVHTLGDACTVAQSGTNARPSNFVKSKPRPQGPSGTAAAADVTKNPDQPTAMDVDVSDDWAALTKEGDQQDAAAAKPNDAAGGAAAAGAAGDGAAAGEDMWDEFAEKAKRQEEELQKQKDEEEQRKRDEEEQKRKLEELEKQKELERQQQQEAQKAAVAEELKAKGVPPGAAAEDGAVAAEVDKLMADADGMDVDAPTAADEDEEEDEEEEGDADDGAGFD